jgi:hypothetical protein
MSAIRNVATVSCMVTLLGCASTPDLVPVIADRNEVNALSGLWDGTYQSNEIDGRSGNIHFELTQGRDSAHGYVIMTAGGLGNRAPAKGSQPVAMPSTELLAIAFVRSASGFIMGELDTYTDPVCGCRLVTRFTGVMRGDEIKGTFTTRHVDTGNLVRGVWWVARARETN